MEQFYYIRQMLVSSINKIKETLFEDESIYSIVFFRIIWGAILLIEVLRYFDRGWIKRYWIDPSFYFNYEGFSFLHPWDGNGMYIHFFFLGVLAIFIMLGLCYRLSSALFFLGFTYIFLLDKTNYLNHFYLISLVSFIMIFIPANRFFSIDAALCPKIKSTFIPRWSLYLLRFQLGIAYFLGGIAKLNADWLQCEPMRMWLGNRTDFPVLGQYFTEEWMVYLFSYGGLLFDLFIIPLLLWKPTRIFAFILAISFHVLNANLFVIGIFPWFMALATPLFFSSNWPSYFFPSLKTEIVPQNNLSPSNFQKFGLGFFLFYIGIQILVPLRHHLYKGNVNWTEQGHRFAWHMKLRNKSGKATFTVKAPLKNKEWKIDMKKYLTKRQRKKMIIKPDMILQFSEHLADIYRKKGYKKIEVYADIKVSLNGRDRQYLIDPSIDLSTVREKNNQKWIVPLSLPLK